MIPQRARRIDENQRAIVAALRKCGASVLILNAAIDLIVGYRGSNFLLEVKRPKRSRLTKTQESMLETWRGNLRVVHSVDEALVAIGATKGGDG